MRTNLTQFTVSFSDLSWESVDVSGRPHVDGSNATATDATFAPIYPKAWHVDRYLRQYFQKFIPADIISFNTRVKYAERVHQDGRIYWKVKSFDCSNHHVEAERTFDYMIVTSGFLERPREIDCKIHNVVPSQRQIRILHSSQFRTLSDLSINGEPLKGGKVLVVGGSHSGGDIAASIAFQMSTGRYSPLSQGAQPLEIVHVMPQPMYAIPPFIPASEETRGFIPLDFLLYRAVTRPPGPISFSFGRMTPERAEGMRNLILSLLNGSKPDSTSLETEKQEDREMVPPYAIVNESYVEFVRSGAIVPKIGRLLKLATQQAITSPRNDLDFLCATVANFSDAIQIEDVAAVVYATGYTASAALSFLPDEVKTHLGFDAAYPRLPLLLESDFLTRTAAISDLAFIGFSNGPYWGVMEMQARVTARRWAFDMELGADERRKQDSANIISCMHDFRRAMANEKSAVPQNLFGDYVGLMEQASRELDLERNDLSWGEREGPICPSRYTDAGTDQKEAQKTMASLQQVMEKALHQGLFVARAAFRALQGNWKTQCLGRQDPQSPALLNQNLTVMASFHPRIPTDPDFDFEYLYIEKCMSVADAGDPGAVSRSLVYRYSEALDKMGVWSVKDDDGNMTAGNLDYLVDFDLADGKPPTKKTWSAIGRNTDGVDTVSSTYTFHFSGAALHKFSIETKIGNTDAGPVLEFVR
ncbi:MAG: hypothetical protein Q9187_001265 [Circinaria calcarea]